MDEETMSGPGGQRQGSGGRAPPIRKSKRPRFRYILARIAGPPGHRLGNDLVGAQASNAAHSVPGSDAKVIEATPQHAIVRVRRGSEKEVRGALDLAFKVRDAEFRLVPVTTSGTLKALRARGHLPPRPAQWKMRRYAEMKQGRR